MNRRSAALAIACLLIVPIATPAGVGTNISWRTLQPGVGLAIRDQLYIVRVDPSVAKLTTALASEARSAPRTAADWCRSSHLAVAINAGMFQNDHKSNVGYLRHGRHLNNAQWNDYQAVVAINSKRALWLDLDSDQKQQTADYDVVIQNLRLITKNRKNVWAPNNRQWSEVALAIDNKGRLLFLFSRAPYSMRELNALLLSLPLNIAGAMHLEGGPEASLSIHTGGIDLDLAGSYETGFWENDRNERQWPIPNVLGVLPVKGSS
jgi:hypothetical protein